MDKIRNLHDLFLCVGERLFNSTEYELYHFGNIEKKATSDSLKMLINKQMGKSRKQQNRLRSAFSHLSELRPQNKEAISISDQILKQMLGIIDRSENGSVRDAAIIISMQTLNHSKIAKYGTLASYAIELGQDKVALFMHDCVEEAKALDHELSILAREEINKNALSGSPQVRDKSASINN